MNSNTWDYKLDGAQTVEEVLGMARDFLARLDPHEIQGLPQKCRPPAKLVDADDIGMFAYDLVRHECGEEDAAELVHRLAHFFSHASMQVARILALQRAATRAYADGDDAPVASLPLRKDRLAG